MTRSSQLLIDLSCLLGRKLSKLYFEPNFQFSQFSLQ